MRKETYIHEKSSTKETCVLSIIPEENYEDLSLLSVLIESTQVSFVELFSCIYVSFVVFTYLSVELVSVDFFLCLGCGIEYIGTPYVSKETYKCEKRHIYTKRALRKRPGCGIECIGLQVSFRIYTCLFHQI